MALVSALIYFSLNLMLQNFNFVKITNNGGNMGQDKKEEHELEEFKPKGAIAFFIVLMIFFAFIWFTLYFEMLGR